MTKKTIKALCISDDVGNVLAATQDTFLVLAKYIPKTLAQAPIEHCTISLPPRRPKAKTKK